MYWLASLCAATALLHSGIVLGVQIPSELSRYFHTDENLIASFNNGTDFVTYPGERLPTKETQDSPNIYVPGPMTGSSPYILLMVDPSYNATVPTNTVLHTIVGNLTAGQAYNASWSDNKPTLALKGPQPVVAPYVGPEPPAHQPSHNYTIMLFSQPPNFQVPSKYDQWMTLDMSDPFTRTNFPVVNFARDTGLGQPVAATYFRLTLTSANQAGSTSTATAYENVASSTSASGSVATGTVTGKTILRALLPTSVYFLI
ncbi:hypothetical protein N7468_002748 [Penicillium chermesinum]|uniref:PEBP-like protein n=1 Tax=Penicillium chermesinum TaxID=63820 RepID=A0A9W9TXX3_9EURO|nr:uncharacterized protein N7468_002748 [Penicillium chermesinum]KAJ5247765.1 hypothetical protein N7468_002748 [Penicillium chermesinum]